MAFIVVAALVVGALAIRGVRTRSAVRRTKEIAAVLRQGQMGSGQVALRQTVDALAFEEVTALRIEDSMRELVPLPKGEGSDESPIQPLQALLGTLEQHSVATAGMEQVLLNVLDMPGPVNQVALYWYAGEVTEHVRAAAQNVLMYVESGHLASDMVGTAANVAESVIRDTLKEPGQALDLLRHVVEGAAHGNALAGVATHFFNEQASLELGLQSLHELVQHMGQHAEVLAAGHQLMDTAIAAEHVAGLDGIHAHFPWVTALLSVHREMSLLNQHTTTPERALENVGLDVVGSGIGGWGGAHVGAVVGSVFPVVGTTVGAVVGAVAGAMYLRWRTNKFKARHLRTAEAEYQRAFDEWHAKSAEAAALALSTVRADAEEARTRYVAAIGPAPRLTAGTPKTMVDVTLRLRRAILAYSADVHRILKRSGKVARQRNAEPELVDAIGALESMVRFTEANTPTEAAIREHPWRALNQIAGLHLPIVADNQYARALDAELQRAAGLSGGLLAGYRRSVTHWGHTATARYKDVTQQLATKVRDQFEAFGQVFKPLQEKTEVAYAAVKRERLSLGIKE